MTQEIERQAIKSFTEALLAINGALLKSGSNKDEAVIMLPKYDYQYWFTVLQYPNSPASKFFKYDPQDLNEFTLAGIKVRGFGK
ncbi:Uncharacterised protein [Acinetobacter phage MD-2021a]|nr:Uncharacterised protein [Acinetobacter phage MD-2021a]CAH1088864.1 Uncharacterised protein [Acinetobacter phage MD-2021a]